MVVEVLNTGTELLLGDVLNTPAEFSAYLPHTSPMYQRQDEISGAREN